MGASAEVVVNLKTLTGDWSTGLKSGGKELTTFVKNAESQFKNLTFANGVGGFVKSFTGITKGAEGFVTNLRTGGSVTKAFGELVNSIPIVGPFKQAGEAIGEMIFGLKAAGIEAQKANEHFATMADGLRANAFVRAGFGKYGDEKATLDIDAGTAKEISDLQKVQTELNGKLRAEEKQVALDKMMAASRGMVWDGSESQLASIKRLKEEIGLNQKNITLANDKNKDAKARQSRDINQRELEIDRAAFAKTEAFKAQADERSLKAQGDILGARIVGIQRAAEAEKLANNATLDETKLGGMTDEQKKHRREQVAKDNLQVDQAAAMDVADLQTEQARREQQITADHQQELTKLQRDGLTTRLQMVSDSLGAELTHIHGVYDDEVAALEKKFSDEHRAMNDPQLLALKSAAGNNRDAAIEAAQFKDREDAFNKHTAAENRTAERQAANRNRLIAESLTPLEKYQSRVIDLKAELANGLPEENFIRLLERANNELGGAISGAGNRKVGAESRRFDFAVPGANAGPQADPLNELRITAKRQAEITAESNKYLANIDRYQRNADANKTTVVNIPG